jgi:hypothetical protein
MNFPWGDLEEGFTLEDMKKTIQLRKQNIQKEWNPFALGDHERELARKAAILRAFFVDHHDGYPPVKCKTVGCECVKHPKPPPHFSLEDEDYCCSVCRMSKGGKHGGCCQG